MQDSAAPETAADARPKAARAPKPVAKEHTTPLTTLLLCLGKGWGMAQEQTLALALALHRTGRHDVRVCCPPDAALARRVRQCCPQDSPLPLVSVTAPRHLLSLFRLWRCQHRKQPLLLHSFDAEALQLAERLTRLRRPGSTLLLHSCLHNPRGAEHGNDGDAREQTAQPPAQTAPQGNGPMPTEAANRGWVAADRIFCANARLRALLTECGLNDRRLAVVHPALDAAALPLRHERTGPTSGRVVLVAAEELHQGAGLFVLLRAMAALWQRTDLPPWEVRVVGAGEALTPILEEARSLGVESRLALLSRQDWAEVLPRCDALLVPHRIPCGNMRAIMAAWCCGLPVVCTDIPAHMEIVRADHTALCVPPGDAQALAAAMIRVLTEPALRAQLAAHGAHQRAYADYSRVVAQTLDAYESCIARKGWVLPPAPPQDAPAGQTKPAPPAQDAAPQTPHTSPAVSAKEDLPPDAE